MLIGNYKRCCGGGGAAQAAPDPVCKDLMNGIIPNLVETDIIGVWSTRLVNYTTTIKPLELSALLFGSV